MDVLQQHLGHIDEKVQIIMSLLAVCIDVLSDPGTKENKKISFPFFVPMDSSMSDPIYHTIIIII
jgi:hypothetical protein